MNMSAKQKMTNKHGFTLVELMVTLTLLLLVLVLTGQFVTTFYRQYAKVEARWWVQTVAKQTMEFLQQSGTEPLSNSTSIDLYYMDDTTEVDYATDEDLSIMKGVPTSGNDDYAYLYSKENANGDDIIYILERGKGNVPVNLTEDVLQITDGTSVAPLKIEFAVSSNPDEAEKVTVGDGTPAYDADGNQQINYLEGENKYIEKTVDVTVRASGQYAGNYSLTSSFTLSNMLANSMVNYDGGKVALTSGDCYIAGYDSAKIALPALIAAADRNDKATETANILRYVSTQSFLDSQNSNSSDIGLEGAGMCTGALSMKGSAVEVQVLGALRDFRDNVLAKSEFGNKIISCYYNQLSPALLKAAQEHPSVLKVVKAVLIPASVVAYFCAE